MTTTQRKNKKGLGRGLSALIPGSDIETLGRMARGDERVSAPAASAPKIETNAETAKPANEFLEMAQWVEINAISANPFQPRRTFAPQELEELASSIRTHGILQPLLVRSTPEKGAFQLVAGERRWRAAQKAGLTKVPVIVRDVDDQQALELALIENVQRNDISALDAAVAYKRLMTDFSLSHNDVADRVGKSRSAISNTVRLLELPIEVQKSIEEGTISEGHGRAILGAPGDTARKAVWRRVVRDQLSVRQTEKLAREASDSDEVTTPHSKESKRISPDVKRIEDSLRKRLGTRVALKAKKQGGQIVIQYFSQEELERLLQLLVA